MSQFQVICTNDSHRPSEIPTSHWVKKDELYTVASAMKCSVQGGLLGYVLEEIDLTPFAPWRYFGAYRFESVMVLSEEEWDMVTKELEI